MIERRGDWVRARITAEAPGRHEVWYVPVFDMGVSDVYYCDECGRPFDESGPDMSRLWDAVALWVALTDRYQPAQDALDEAFAYYVKRSS